MLNKLPKGTRVKLTAEALDHFKHGQGSKRVPHDSALRGTVSTNAQGNIFISVLRDGVVTPESYARRFWEPADDA